MSGIKIEDKNLFHLRVQQEKCDQTNTYNNDTKA